MRDGSVSVLKGADAAFDVKAIRNIQSAEMDGKTQATQSGEIVTDYEPITADVDRQFEWKDQDGLTPHDPFVLKVKAVADDPPTIVARRDSQEEVVLDSEVVTFALTATDDFGVKEVGLEWAGSLMQADGKTPVTGEKIVAAGEPEKRNRKRSQPFAPRARAWNRKSLEIRLGPPITCPAARTFTPPPSSCMS